MPEPPVRPGRVGTIDGESTQFVDHHLDPDGRAITITVIQRGSRSLERLQRAMSGERITVTLPGDQHSYPTSPVSIDVTTTGKGEQAFHRARLVLQLINDDEADEQHLPFIGTNLVPDRSSSIEGQGLAARLDSIEAKLDRLLAILGQDENVP